LGPHHDWSSHGSDAFGLMCVDRTIKKMKRPEREPVIKRYTNAIGAWMGG